MLDTGVGIGERLLFADERESPLCPGDSLAELASVLPYRLCEVARKSFAAYRLIRLVNDDGEGRVCDHSDTLESCCAIIADAGGDAERLIGSFEEYIDDPKVLAARLTATVGREKAQRIARSGDDLHAAGCTPIENSAPEDGSTFDDGSALERERSSHRRTRRGSRGGRGRSVVSL